MKVLKKILSRKLYILVYIKYCVGDNMKTNIFQLLKQEEEMISQANEMRIKLVEEKRLRELDEANAWVMTDFKSLGATSDKLRSAVVKQKMNTMPNVYAQKKAKFENLEQEIRLIRDIINVMREFGVEEIEFKEDQDENASSETSG